MRRVSTVDNYVIFSRSHQVCQSTLMLMLGLYCEESNFIFKDLALMPIGTEELSMKRVHRLQIFKRVVVKFSDIFL